MLLGSRVELHPLAHAQFASWNSGQRLSPKKGASDKNIAYGITIRLAGMKALVVTKANNPGRSKLPSKTAGISHYQSPNIYTPEGRRKLSVSSVERSPLVVANSVDAEVTCVFNFSHTNFN